MQRDLLIELKHQPFVFLITINFISLLVFFNKFHFLKLY